MKLNAYLSFNGDCEAAFRFYEKVLGGKIVALIPYSEMPAGAGGGGPDCAPPADLGSKIMHARIAIGDQLLMGSDCPPGRFDAPKGTMINIGLEQPAEAERIFKALSEGGTVTMPIQETFWAQRFGMFIDRFGTPWMINCEKQHAVAAA